MKRVILVIVALSFISCSFSQSTLRPNLYVEDLNYYNVAAVTVNDSLQNNLLLYGKHKIVNQDDAIWNKPPMLFANHIGTLMENETFYNIGYVRDQYSFYNRNTIYAGFIHQLEVGEIAQNKFSFGGRMIFNLDHVYWKKLNPQPIDPENALNPNVDLDLGIYYKTAHWSLGLSSKNIIGNGVKRDGDYIILNQREFYFFSSYLFHFGDHFMAKPHILLRHELSTEADLGVNVSFFRVIDAGYQVRLLRLRHVFSLSANVSRRWKVGVAFDKSPLFSDYNADAYIQVLF